MAFTENVDHVIQLFRQSKLLLYCKEIAVMFLNKGWTLGILNEVVCKIDSMESFACTMLPWDCIEQ